MRIRKDLIQKGNKNFIDKIYLYAKNLDERKYQFLIEKRENVGIKNLNDPNAFMNIQILWMMFTIILMITMLKEKEKF